LTQVQDNAGNRTVYTLDALGNRIAEQVFDPNQVLARTRSREFNSLNRLIKDIGGTNPGVQVTRYNYDLQGNAAASTDPLGNTHAYLYDALHRLIQVLDPAPVGTGAGGSTQYAYDGLDQLTLITDARGLATSYTVDGLGNLTRLTSPDTGLASSAYDAAGNLIQQLDTRGVIGRFTYDALNRITQAVYTPPTGSDIEPLSISYSYDQSSFGVGRLSGITDSSGSIALAYDVHGRLASETRTIAGVAYTTSYTYDASGRLIRLTYPSGRTVDYTLNALERIQQIDTSYAGVTQPLVSAVTYQPFGAINGFTFGNAQGVSLPRDLDGRLISYPIGGITRTLTYDAASRISAYRHADPLLDQTFEYDNLNRLGAWTATSGNQRYGYDPVGNRTTLTIGAVVYNASYAPTSNRLVNGSFPVPFDYQYDEAGNTRRDALRSYSYDAGSRLTQVSSNGVLSRFTFNALGQRVMKAPANGLPRVFHYDAGGRLIAESTVAGEVLREYVYLGELPVAMLSSDHDDDGVPDARDNCILDPNPDQTDTSASGYGNVCNGDANGDGVVNQTDLNLAITLSHRVGGASTLAGKRADMNADGVLNAQDQALISQWIKQRGVPGPSGLRTPPAGPELFYIYADQIGTPRALIDAASNKVRWQWQVADPFGIQPPIQNPQSDFISLPFNLRFPGQYYDRETGLHHGPPEIMIRPLPATSSPIRWDSCAG
jgi:YD repeat-containing protein